MTKGEEGIEEFGTHKDRREVVRTNLEKWKNTINERTNRVVQNTVIYGI